MLRGRAEMVTVTVTLTVTVTVTVTVTPTPSTEHRALPMALEDSFPITLLTADTP